MKIPVCHVPQYDAWVVGLLGMSSEAAEAYVWKKYKVHQAFDSDGRCLVMQNGNRLTAIVHLREFSMKPKHLALLAHECTHAALCFLHEIGQGVSTKDHEHLTYLIQYIFQSMLEPTKNHKQQDYQQERTQEPRWAVTPGMSPSR